MNFNYVFFGLILGVVLIAGCGKTERIESEFVPPADTGVESDPAMPIDRGIVQDTTTGRVDRPRDVITAEATVLTLTGTEGGDIRIDTIVDYVRQPDANYDPITAGRDYTVRFSYTRLPAIVKCETLFAAEIDSNKGKEQPGEEGQLPLSPGYDQNQPIPEEDGYLIYTYGTGQCPPDKVLPGIEEGDKIRFTTSHVWDSSMGERVVISIGEYDVIS